MLLLKQISTFFTQIELNKIPANRKYRHPINIQNRLCTKRKKVTENGFKEWNHIINNLQNFNKFLVINKWLKELMTYGGLQVSWVKCYDVELLEFDFESRFYYKIILKKYEVFNNRKMRKTLWGHLNKDLEVVLNQRYFSAQCGVPTRLHLNWNKKIVNKKKIKHWVICKQDKLKRTNKQAKQQTKWSGSLKENCRYHTQLFDYFQLNLP